MLMLRENWRERRLLKEDKWIVYNKVKIRDIDRASG